MKKGLMGVGTVFFELAWGFDDILAGLARTHEGYVRVQQ